MYTNVNLSMVNMEEDSPIYDSNKSYRVKLGMHLPNLYKDTLSFFEKSREEQVGTTSRTG